MLSSRVRSVIVEFGTCDVSLEYRLLDALKVDRVGKRCVSRDKSSHGSKFSSSRNVLMFAKALWHLFSSSSVSVVSRNRHPLFKLD